MIESLYIAETGMSSQQQLIDVISNNIANTSTPGFKKSQLNFVDLVYQRHAENIDGDPGAQPEAFHGAGVKVTGDAKDFSVGQLKQTNNPFDVAIQGTGFIQVLMDNNEFGYTRAGRLRLDDEGFLVTSQGLRLASEIQIPPDASQMTISPTGEVSVLLEQRGETLILGELELVKFTNDAGLKTLGNNLYAAEEASGEAMYVKPGEMGSGVLVQGMTEISNVSMTEEMVNLMLAQRGYQLNARIIQISDQLLDTINNLRK